MGILIKDSIQTETGQTGSIYGRVSNIRIDKYIGIMEFVFSYYSSPESAKKVGRKLYNLQEAGWEGGEISPVVHSGSFVWDDITMQISSSIDSTIELPTYYFVPLTSSMNIEVPTTIILSRSVEFVDFDENGDPFVNTQIIKDTIETSSLEFRDDVVDLNKVNNDFYGFSYTLVSADIQKLLPNAILEEI